MKRNKFLKTILGLPLVFTSMSFTNKPKKSLEKTIFTPEMLRRHNVGLFIVNIKAGDIVNSKNIGYAATVAWKICYHISPLIKPKNEDDGKFNIACNKYGKVNVFTDGWFCPMGNTDEEVCKYLNNNPYGESYRLMTKEEVIYLILNRKQGFL